MLPRNVLIIAAEDSSAAYATKFLDCWNKKFPDSLTHFWGIGSAEMMRFGFEAIATPRDMALMGFYEVVRHYPKLRRVFFQILNQIRQNPPDVAILMDYPGFNIRLAKKMRPFIKRIIYWIPPQVWAWKQNRVKDLKKYVDEVISVFPFEFDFLKDRGVNTFYFGHPVVSLLSKELWDHGVRHRQRARAGIDANSLVIGLLPGSRLKEIEHHLPSFLQAAELIYRQYPQAIFLIPVAPSLRIEDIRQRLGHISFPLIIQKREKPEESLMLLDYAVAASGTVTLLLALLKIPMVICYQVSTVTYFLMRLFVRFGITHFGLPNLLSRERHITELFQYQVTPENIFQEVHRYFSNQEYQTKIHSQLDHVHQSLINSDQPIERIVDHVAMTATN
ncbi:MAG: lipid-A-disaccharide synthase [Bdellovibrionaceae bacterium]|nr:lipid-A-disaccharide synthase [Pseudobdellovibrionaceae bacterium]MDW8189682.1 lipid-A-disaccharide synthase [Pseudobdellovibrionaceae bacterium]